MDENGSDKTTARFASLAEALGYDADALRKSIDGQLIAENGQQWFDDNRQFLDEDWTFALQLLGYGDNAQVAQVTRTGKGGGPPSLYYGRGGTQPAPGQLGGAVSGKPDTIHSEPGIMPQVTQLSEELQHYHEHSTLYRSKAADQQVIRDAARRAGFHQSPLDGDILYIIKPTDNDQTKFIYSEFHVGRDRNGRSFLQEVKRKANISADETQAIGDALVPRSGLSPVLRRLVDRGGPGSGHHGHKGIPGHRGGSAPDEEKPAEQPHDLASLEAPRAAHGTREEELRRATQFLDEANRVPDAIEKGIVIAADGTVVMMKGGDAHSVVFNDQEIQQMDGATLIHNHPDYGNSLSMEDCALAMVANMREIRAVSTKQDKVFILSRPEGVDWGPPAWNYQGRYRFAAADMSVRKTFIQQINSGKRSIGNAESSHHDAVMRSFATRMNRWGMKNFSTRIVDYKVVPLSKAK